MDTAEDIAWELRTLLNGKARLDSENSDGVWLEKVVNPDNTVETLLLLECGGMGIADRLRKAQRRARELGVPLKVINGVSGAANWAASGSENRKAPVSMMTLEQMDVWLERHYPRRKFFSVLY